METREPIQLDYALSPTHVFALREGAAITLSIEVSAKDYLLLKSGYCVILHLESSTTNTLTCIIQDVESIQNDGSTSVLARVTLVN